MYIACRMKSHRCCIQCMAAHLIDTTIGYKLLGTIAHHNMCLNAINHISANEHVLAALPGRISYITTFLYKSHGALAAARRITPAADILFLRQKPREHWSTVPQEACKSIWVRQIADSTQATPCHETVQPALHGCWRMLVSETQTLNLRGPG